MTTFRPTVVNGNPVLISTRARDWKQELQRVGQLLGLTEAEVVEVIDAYVASAMCRGATVPPQVVNEAVARRASGQQWEPRYET